MNSLSSRCSFSLLPFQDWATITTKQIFPTEKLIRLAIVKVKQEHRANSIFSRREIVSFYTIHTMNRFTFRANNPSILLVSLTTERYPLSFIYRVLIRDIYHGCIEISNVLINNLPFNWLGVCNKYKRKQVTFRSD